MAAPRRLPRVTAITFGYPNLTYPSYPILVAAPRRWPRVMAITYGFTLPLYWMCGLLGYYAYGDFSKANINLNFPVRCQVKSSQVTSSHERHGTCGARRTYRNLS